MALVSGALAVLGVASGSYAGLTTLDETGDLLSTGATITASSTIFSTGQAVDNATSDFQLNTDNGQLFNGTANGQMMSVTSFGDSPVAIIRLHTLLEDAQRVPVAVTVRSSTSSTTSLTAGTYETALGTFTLGPGAFSTPSPVANAQPAAGSEYASLFINAPAGTRSLFLDFSSDANFGFSGVRVSEIQVYAVPEPATLGLLGLSSLGLLSRRRGRTV